MAFFTLFSILSALTAGCASIMQFWMSIVVFNNDYNCHKVFYISTNGNNTEIICRETLIKMEQWYCECRLDLYDNSWIRAFDYASVILAILLFIFLFCTECWRSFWMLGVIFGMVTGKLPECEYFSPLGFFAIILRPSGLEKRVFLSYESLWLIVLDALAIGLIFQYRTSVNAKIQDTFILASLISTCCDAGCRLISTFYLILQNQRKRRNPSVKLGSYGSMTK